MPNVPFPNLWNAASGLAQQQLNAQFGAIARSSHRETRSGRKFIRRLAHSFADELGGLSQGLGNQYNQVVGQEQGAASAISNYLTGQAGTMAGDVGGQLSFSPEAQAAQQGLIAGTGKAAAGMAAAQGGSAVENFLGAKGENLAYAHMLPGVAALTGIQDAAAFQAQQSQDLKSQRDALMGQAPGLTADLYSAFASQRLQQQQMAQEARFHNQDLAQRRREMGLTSGGQDSERLDAAHADAFNLIQMMRTGPGGLPLQGGGPGYGDMHERLVQLYQQRFPGSSQSWLSEQADHALGQFGVTPELPGIGGFLRGILPQGTNASRTSSGPGSTPAGYQGPISSSVGFRPTGRLGPGY